MQSGDIQGYMQDALPQYIPIKTHKSLPSLTAGMMKTLVWSKD